ncbi:hypothetical protein ABIA44_001005 [Bradyrhizobium sp. USDA 329]
MRLFIDSFGLKLPDNIDLGPAICRKHVRDRIHAAVGVAGHFRHIVLDDQPGADLLDVDHHAAPVVCGADAGRNVIRRAAAQIFGFGEREQPFGDVHSVERYINYRGIGRLRQDAIESLHDNLLSFKGLGR